MPNYKNRKMSFQTEEAFEKQERKPYFEMNMAV